MSIYKNGLDETVRLRIEPRIGTEGIYLELKENGNRATTVFPPKDAPSLALAILEAAGVESVYHGSFVAGSEWQLEHATGELREYVRARAVKDAEAKERAELEAEAEALYLTYFEAADVKCKDWRILDQYIKDYWFAVARRAREMRAEK